MNKDCLVGLMFGLGIGAAVGILTATRSGEQTRAKLRGDFRQGVDSVKDQANKLRDSAMRQVERRKEGLSEAVDAGKQAYRQAAG